MKRLTFRDKSNRPCYKYDGVVYQNEIAERLAAYEDLKKTPEEIASLLATLNTKKKTPYIPGDIVYDKYGMAWTVSSVEAHKLTAEGPIKYLYHCGHPGTNDYCALYQHEIST